MADTTNWVFGPKKEVKKLDRPLGQLFLERLVAHGEKVAQVIQIGGVEHSITFAEVLLRSKIVATVLREHGVKRGDVVMSVFGNTLENAPVLFGTLFAGAAPAPVNPLYEKDDLLHIIGTFIPDVIICNEAAEQLVQEVILLTENPNIVFISIATLLARYEAKPDMSDFQLTTGLDVDQDIATILCTSGSSGKPKGVETTHAALYRQMGINHLKADGTETEQLVAVNIAGPFGNVGQMINLMSMNGGMKAVLVPIADFEEKFFLRTLEKYKVNFIVLGPIQLIALAKIAADGNYDLSSIKGISCGGSPMSVAMIQMATKVMKCPIAPSYGMTECLGIFSAPHGVTNKPGTVGTIMPNVIAKIVDLETGKALGKNKEGEFRYKSEACFLRYRNQPELRKEAFDSDDFYKSGDTAYYDEDGYFFFLDRVKELIKYRNVHVPASDIEEVLLKHPAVRDAAVIGIYHEIDWEHATGIVVLRPGEKVTEEELVQLVQDNLPKFKWLHGGVKFVTSLPRSKGGNDKVDKKALRTQYGGQPLDLPTIGRKILFKPDE